MNKPIDEFAEQAKRVDEQFVKVSLHEEFDRLDAEYLAKGYDPFLLEWGMNQYPMCDTCGRGLYDADGVWHCKYVNKTDCEHLDEIKKYVEPWAGLPGTVMEELELFMDENEKEETIPYDEMWNFLIAEENKESLEKFYDKYMTLSPEEQKEWADKVTDDITAIIQLAET